MTGITLGLLGVAVILLVDELFWRLHVMRGETSRKLVHVLAGTYIAFWPFMMNFEAIQALAILMLIVVALSRRFKIFRSIHDVKRRTYGEYFFPISIGLCAVITNTPWVFTAAILHLSLADGLAAIAGITLGDDSKYKIFGQTKSWAGTFTFYLASLFIVSYIFLYQIDNYDTATVLLGVVLPPLATLGESVAAYGTDDLVVPLSVCTLLSAMVSIS